MSDKTRIEWTDATWNPVRGCSLVSDGCRNCYAMHVAARFNGAGMPYEGLTMQTSQGPKWTGEISLVPGMMDQPLKWQRPRKIFVNSMSDLFHEGVPFDYIAAVFGVMAGASHHTYQILTKRPERMLAFFKWIEENPERKRFDCDALYAKFPGDDWQPFMLANMAANALPGCDNGGRYRANIIGRWPLPNVWLGVSVEDQATADERIPLLLEAPAALRWLSMEPLLGPVSLWGNPAGDVLCGGTDSNDATQRSRIDWVVAGGESGLNARPMHPQWVRSLRDECTASGVPFFFKQWGEWAPRNVTPADTLLPLKKWGWISINGGKIDQTLGQFKDELAHHEQVARLGKKAAGRMLDGRTWDEFPGSLA